MVSLIVRCLCRNCSKILCADEFGLDFKQHISWVYKQGGDSRTNKMVKYAVRMEHLEWFVKPGAEHTFNLDAGTEQYTEAEKVEALAKGVGRVTSESLARGKPPKNRWDIPRENSRSKQRDYGSHPSMKPLRICDRIVGIHSNVGGTVLVPFGGSGSECIAVAAAGRKLIAFEREDEYFRIIRRRMKGWGLLSGPPTPPPETVADSEGCAQAPSPSTPAGSATPAVASAEKGGSAPLLIPHTSLPSPSAISMASAASLSTAGVPPQQPAALAALPASVPSMTAALSATAALAPPTTAVPPTVLVSPSLPPHTRKRPHPCLDTAGLPE